MTRLLALFLATCTPVPAFAQDTCVCPSDGWRADESLDDRISRLERQRDENEVALRLAKAEKRVREGRKGKRP